MVGRDVARELERERKEDSAMWRGVVCDKGADPDSAHTAPAAPDSSAAAARSRRRGTKEQLANVGKYMLMLKKGTQCPWLVKSKKSSNNTFYGPSGGWVILPAGAIWARARGFWGHHLRFGSRSRPLGFCPHRVPRTAWPWSTAPITTPRPPFAYCQSSFLSATT